MKPFLPSLGALALLAACATEPQPVETHPVNPYRGAALFWRREPVAYQPPVSPVAAAAMQRRVAMEAGAETGTREIETVGVNSRPAVFTPPTVASQLTPPASSVTPPSEPLASSSPAPVAERERAPIATPVPGKPGMVTSPFAPNAGYIDVTGMTPGSEAKDPYSGRVFRVP
jgi:hypothetical protein